MGKISREAQIHKNEYKKKNSKDYVFYYDKNKDYQVINKIKSARNKTEYIRSLIRSEDEIFAKYAYSFHEKVAFPKKENEVRISINISRKSAQDVIDKLDAVANKSLYIRDLVLNDIRDTQKIEE